MNKQRALQYLHDQIELELKLIKNIHDHSKGTSFLSDAERKSKEDHQYLKSVEDIKVLTIAGCISSTTADKLKGTINSARQFIEVE